MRSLEEGEIVLCNVTKIDRTVVFVDLEDYNRTGHITFPEIAPGRIRNIRDFAFPGKKIVCKVLKIRPETVELSLRRVKVNERNDFNDHSKRERSYAALIKTIVGEKSEEIINKIKDKGSLFELIEQAKENPSLLEAYIPKDQTERILKILNEKKTKETTISKRFALSSKAKNGMVLVKTIITGATKNTNAEVSYIAAGKYIIKIKAKDPKQADNQILKVISSIETNAKKNDCDYDEIKI